MDARLTSGAEPVSDVSGLIALWRAVEILACRARRRDLTLWGAINLPIIKFSWTGGIAASAGVGDADRRTFARSRLS